MDAALMFPCLVIGAAIIAFTGLHVSLGRWVNRLAANWIDVEVNHQGHTSTRAASQDKTARRGFAFWAMSFGITTLLVLVILLIVAAFVIGTMILSLPPDYWD